MAIVGLDFIRLEDFHLNDVKAESYNGYDNHYAALNLNWVVDSVSGLEQQENSDSPNEEHTDKGTENLGSVISESKLLGGFALCHDN